MDIQKESWRNDKEYMQYLQDIADGKIMPKYACCCIVGGESKEISDAVIRDNIDYNRAFELR